MPVSVLAYILLGSKPSHTLVCRVPVILHWEERNQNARPVLCLLLSDTSQDLITSAWKEHQFKRDSSRNKVKLLKIKKLI